ncbi:MAG TPA: helix-turn-helix transcriptional regulator [Armatimonadota bacterium]|nr:helix-turn-helix transcriptional regulator [Armatimonadota bacterium]
MANQRQQLIAFRRGLGYTQEHMASVMGISTAQYCRYEAGIRTPRPKVLQRFAAHFGMTEWQAVYFFAHDVAIPSCSDMARRDEDA